MREDELRESTRKGLRRTAAVFEPVWSELMRLGYVADVQCGARDPVWLVEHGREILARGAAAERTDGAADDEPSAGAERVWALSQLVAHQAADDPDVVAFRLAHLPDGLISWEGVEGWLNVRDDEDGEWTSDVSFNIPPGTTVEWDGPTARFNPPIAAVPAGIRFSHRTLAYAQPGDRGVRRRSVTAGGVLDWLRVLSENLADAFAWQPALAAVFVLTGITPMIPAARIGVPAVKIRHHTGLDWSRRITLNVDPAASTQEVLAAFEDARREYERHPRPHPAPANHGGRRQASAKHHRLAAFACAEHVDKPWAERLRLWNERFPEWAYPAESNFRRDAGVAKRRLLSP